MAKADKLGGIILVVLSIVIWIFGLIISNSGFIFGGVVGFLMGLFIIGSNL